MNIGKKYKTSLSNGLRPDLQPNNRDVICVGDKGNDYLVVSLVTSEPEPNIWITHKKHLCQIKK